MQQYQNWLAHYLVCRRDGDHAMAAELAESISSFWEARGNKDEYAKWQKVYHDHQRKIT